MWFVSFSGTISITSWMMNRIMNWLMAANTIHCHAITCCCKIHAIYIPMLTPANVLQVLLLLEDTFVCARHLLINFRNYILRAKCNFEESAHFVLLVIIAWYFVFYIGLLTKTMVLNAMLPFHLFLRPCWPISSLNFARIDLKKTCVDI